MPGVDLVLLCAISLGIGASVTGTGQFTLLFCFCFLLLLFFINVLLTCYQINSAEEPLFCRVVDGD